MGWPRRRCRGAAVSGWQRCTGPGRQGTRAGLASRSRSGRAAALAAPLQHPDALSFGNTLGAEQGHSGGGAASRGGKLRAGQQSPRRSRAAKPAAATLVADRQTAKCRISSHFGELSVEPVTWNQSVYFCFQESAGRSRGCQILKSVVRGRHVPVGKPGLSTKRTAAPLLLPQRLPLA